ncbi:MAG: permease [Firmicutes bacterium]|nr:permease [Bacillota bacterium]
MIFQPPKTLKHSPTTREKWALALFLILSLILLYLAKWGPYARKLPIVSHSHTLGPSIISGYTNRPPTPSWNAAWQFAWLYFQDIWVALVAGMVIGAGIETLVPRGWLAQKLGTMGWKSRLWAGLSALPSMMCTCCSSPIVVNLKRSNVSTGAAFSYWVANPLLNPATIVFMGFVLGWNWAAWRVLLGILLVGITGILGDYWLPQGVHPGSLPTMSPQITDERILRAFIKSISRLIYRLIPEYVLLVMLLGIARAWLLPAMNPQLGHAWWILLALAFVGTLFVVPTAGEIPIVFVLLHYGLGTGAAMVLLITLPAISLPSAAMVSRAISLRVLAQLGLVIAVFGVISGITAALFIG